MSIRTMSGSSWVASDIATSPLSASPMTSMSGCAFTRSLMPVRTVLWSSARRTRNFFSISVISVLSERNSHKNGRAAAGGRFDIERTRDECCPLTHTYKAKALAELSFVCRIYRIEAHAVVLDYQHQIAIPLLEQHVYLVGL